MICTVMERMAWCGVISRLSSRRHAWDACTVAASGLTAVQMAVAIRQAVRQTVGLSRLQKKKKGPCLHLDTAASFDVLSADLRSLATARPGLRRTCARPRAALRSMVSLARHDEDEDGCGVPMDVVLEGGE